MNQNEQSQNDISKDIEKEKVGEKIKDNGVSDWEENVLNQISQLTANIGSSTVDKDKNESLHQSI